ncbi:MAG: sulfatase-like hydrolase/transferase [Bacteroidota bacterium]
MRFFLLSMLAFLCFGCAEKTPTNIEEASLPNIVLLIGDDQGYPYFGFMGADYVHTPNMDSLAARGTVFTQGYVPANHCRPSLQSLMTASLPWDYNKQVEALWTEHYQELDTTPDNLAAAKADFDHHAMQHFPTLPRLLAEKGYASFQGGKWWEYHYENGGFTHGMTTGWTTEERKNGSKWFKQFMGGNGLKLARYTMQPAYDFIDAHTEQPFFLWFAPELPHYPFDAPEKYYNQYADMDMTESAKRYYANCTWFDDGVGALVSYLREKGLYENTLFVYVNDNGWEQGPTQEFRSDSLRWHNGGDKGKLSVYDQSFRTPIIFAWPGKITSGQYRQQLVHSSDIPVTIMDYLNIEKPEGVFGQSLRDLLAGSAEQHRSHIVGYAQKMRSEADMMGMDIHAYWLRDSTWFYSWNMTTGVERLHHILDDPNSDQNVVEEHPVQVALFQEQINRWREARWREAEE